MSQEQRADEIELLIEEFKRSGLRELQARCGNFEIFLSMDPDAAASNGAARIQAQQHSFHPKSTSSPETVATPQAIPTQAPEPGRSDWPEGASVIRAPYLGSFYRSPKPGVAPYVEVGSRVTPESELCLVEVMKLFTSVRAGVAGCVIEVLASDGELVSADQPLFVVMPD